MKAQLLREEADVVYSAVTRGVINAVSDDELVADWEA
jgi:hypothetical protein